MATSSIFADVRIDTPSKLESFLKALEQAEKNKETSAPPKSGIPMITDPEMIRQMFARRQQRENAARKL